MAYSFSVRSVAAVGAALGLALALVAPASAQSDAAGQGSTNQGSDAQSAPAAPSTTSLDPCQLVTSAEASTLAGTTYATGREETTDGGSRVCVYGYQTRNVFMVLVTQAPDADTAQAAWADEQARAQALMQRDLPGGLSPNVSVNQDAGVAGYDNSATAAGGGTIGGRTLNISAIYLLKGPTFVTYSDLLLDNAAPTTDALAAQAKSVLTRLP
jgi:hypothetical protein